MPIYCERRLSSGRQTTFLRGLQHRLVSGKRFRLQGGREFVLVDRRMKRYLALNHFFESDPRGFVF